jgi:uncharacterized protein YndB with AHSA1/START domain
MSDEAELTYTRVFDAPRELVFRCMLEPEHLTHFWGPAGTTTPLDGITVDPRPGGVFEALMVSDADGSSYTMRAVYRRAGADRVVRARHRHGHHLHLHRPGGRPH